MPNKIIHEKPKYVSARVTNFPIKKIRNNWNEVSTFNLRSWNCHIYFLSGYEKSNKNKYTVISAIKNYTLIRGRW